MVEPHPIITLSRVAFEVVAKVDRCPFFDKHLINFGSSFYWLVNSVDASAPAHILYCQRELLSDDDVTTTTLGLALSGGMVQHISSTVNVNCFETTLESILNINPKS